MCRPQHGIICENDLGNVRASPGYSCFARTLLDHCARCSGLAMRDAMRFARKGDPAVAKIVARGRARS
jgi:hypothetical protein